MYKRHVIGTVSLDVTINVHLSDVTYNVHVYDIYFIISLGNYQRLRVIYLQFRKFMIVYISGQECI